MAWIAVFLGGSAPALAIVLRPALIENLAIPALLAAPSIVVLAFSMGVLLYHVRPAASLFALCIGAGLVSILSVVPNQLSTVTYSVTPMSCAAHLLAGLAVGVPSVVFRWAEFEDRARTGFVAAIALVLGATLGFSEHHSIRPVAMAIERLQPSPELPRFNRIGGPLEEFQRQRQAGRDPERGTKNPPSSVLSVGPLAANPNLPVRPGPEREQKFQESLKRALDAGTLQRNPVLERMRNAVVNGAAAVKAAPCNDAARGALHDAIITFIRDMPAIANRYGTETFSADGITRETSIELNQPALKITRAALYARLVTIGEFPAMATPSFTDPQPAHAVELGATLRCINPPTQR